MKISDGLFHRVFDEIGAEYGEIEKEHWIVDIGAAKLADTPEAFDVVVMPNLYGDILSDVGAQIAGSVGLAGSANVGEICTMFEAIHGSAPRRAGQNVANPSGLLHGAILMLVHINQAEIAERVHNAWLRTIEDGVHTYDIFKEGVSREKVGTQEFAQAVVARIGQRPEKLKAVAYNKDAASSAAGAATGARAATSAAAKKETVGVDVFLDCSDKSAEEIGRAMEQAGGDGLRLEMVTNRGTRVYPGGLPETFCTDHWRCRFLTDGGAATGHKQITNLLDRIADAGFDFIKTENLCTFDGKEGYSA